MRLSEDQATSRQDARRAGRILSIAPGTPFLRELACALVDGRLVDGFRPLDDAFVLPSATVYLPTRRAARMFTSEIVEALGGRAALLPRIRTLGDGEEEEFDLALLPPEPAELPPAAGTLERQFKLATMVRSWTTALSTATRELFGDEDIVLPSSAADALKLAGDLARLLDQMETEEVAWSAIDSAIDGEHAAWWDLTAAFLKIVAEHWPQHLRDIGKLDPAEARRELLDLRTRQLTRHPPAGPVIAAGTTGSIPATARLLKAVAALDNGAVVLPGIDFDLPDPVWRQLGDSESGEDAPILTTHPQYGLARLLGRLGVTRGEVGRLGEPPAAVGARARMIGLAMLPANETGRWADRHDDAATAGQDLAIIEAPGEREEALAIAIALREVLEAPGKTAALTTPDRQLACRVAAELGRWGIEIDDSAGTPLDETPAGRFALQLTRIASGPSDPVALTAFLKEPMLAMHEPDRARAARLFELTVLRGALVVPVPGELEAAIEGARVRIDKGHSGGRTVGDDDWVSMTALARHVDLACAQPCALRRADGPVALAAALAAIRTAIAELLDDPDGTRLSQLDGGRELALLFEAFEGLDGEHGGPMNAPVRELATILQTLMRNVVVRELRQPHPRLAIWGPLEARLLGVDRMILGGLNEGTWPATARNDPFLNRPMRGELGLSFPERRIGQAAHDFEQLSGAPEVIYARALKADNAPTVASRWLQRLTAVAGEDRRKAMLSAGQRYLDLARSLDRPDVGGDRKTAKRAVRPCPRPPVELRPRRLSITEIETWIRDPYAIHARHVLGLRPLEPLERVADPALRGTVYHAILARFVAGRPKDETRAAAQQRMDALARDLFASHGVPGEIAASWLPRFAEVGRLFIAWDAERAGQIDKSLCEVPGEIEVGTSGFILRGRADRIDLTRGGEIAILDYKTGTNPSVEQARIFSPQLSLEGRMAELGGFGEEAARPVAKLAYVRLRAGDELKVNDIAGGRKPVPVRDLAGKAWSELERLVAAYEDGSQGYLSRYAVMQEGEVGGDYDHLARVREWSLGETEDGDG